MTEKTDISYGIIPLFRNGNQCMSLLVHHTKGHWGFPKGHPKEGEDSIQTALREFYEETGITDCKILPGISFEDSYEYQDANGETIHKSVTYYLAVVHDPRVEVKMPDVTEAKWLDLNGVLDTATFEGSKKIIVDAQKYLHEQNLI